MSKKTKTSAKDGAPKIESVNQENQDEQTSDNAEAVETEQTQAATDDNQVNPESQPSPDSPPTEADSSAAPLSSEASEETDNSSDNDNSSSELKTTGEILINEEFVDTMVLSRLRAKVLPLSDIYREAQIFSAQPLSVPELLTSSEPILIQNLIEILRMLDLWYDKAVQNLLTDNDSLFESVSRYIIQCFKNDIVPVSSIQDALFALNAQGNARISQFAERFSSAIIWAIEQHKSEIPTLQSALTRLCSLLDKTTVSRLLYDPSPVIRIAVIRHFQNCEKLEINDLSVALILLKDKDESVNIALMRLLAKRTPCPELAIPQLLAAMNSASDMLRNEILDVLRNYGNDAIDPVMHAFESTQPGISDAVQETIAQCPQRYTDALIKTLSSCRATDLAKGRIADILRKHKDPAQAEEIRKALYFYQAPEFQTPPKWKQPVEDTKFAKPTTDTRIIYEKVLSKEEILPLIPEFSNETIGKLLGDASETVIINALNLIKYANRASEANLQLTKVWLKSSSFALASAALDAYLSVEKDVDKSAESVIEAFQHGESDDVKKHYFTIMLQHQDNVDAIIRKYYDAPRKCVGFIQKFLALNPNEHTLNAILKGMDRTQSVACISETMMCFLRTKFVYDNRPIRPLLFSHLTTPISFGQYGFMTRLFAIRLLRKYMLADETPDRESITALQAFHKDGKNAELRLMAKELLKDLGEEIFDFEDEEDDFEDLNDEEDDF